MGNFCVFILDSLKKRGEKAHSGDLHLTKIFVASKKCKCYNWLWKQGTLNLVLSVCVVDRWQNWENVCNVYHTSAFCKHLVKILAYTSSFCHCFIHFWWFSSLKCDRQRSLRCCGDKLQVPLVPPKSSLHFCAVMSHSCSGAVKQWLWCLVLVKLHKSNQ